MSKEVEGVETRGRARKASRSRDILSALEDRVVTLESSMGDIKERVEDVDDRLHAVSGLDWSDLYLLRTTFLSVKNSYDHEICFY